MDEKQAAALREPFLPAQIGKLPRGGVTLDFVGHAATTDRLLQVDPGWTWEPLATDEHGLPLLDKGGNLWIKLTVAGVTRLGVGDGKSAKELIGDAIRNAAMRFGVALDLWAKEDLWAQENPEPIAAPKPATRTVKRAPRAAPETNGAAPEQPDPAASPIRNADDPLTDLQRTKIVAAMKGLNMSRDQALDFVAGVIGERVGSRNELKREEASRVIDRLERLESAAEDKASATEGAEPELTGWNQ